MNPILMALAVPAAMALIFGAVVAWDRLREPRRDPRRPFAVVDGRTYRDAQRRIERLLDAGDPDRARYVMHAICGWLRREIHTGRRSRRVKRAAQLEQWEMRMEQLATDVAQ